MKYIKFLFLFSVINSTICCSGDLECSDFRSGTFYMPVSNASEKYSTIVFDSINKEPLAIKVERNPNIEKYIIIRNNNSQVEWVNEVGKGKATHEIIEWIDECSYRLIADKNKMDLDIGEQEINENGGIVIEKIGVINKCMEYRATMTTPEGHKITQLGLICKE